MANLVPSDDLPSNIVPADDLPESTAPSAPSETAGRVAGLTGRALAKGTAELPNAIATVASPLSTMANISGMEQALYHKTRQTLGFEKPITAAPAAPTAPARPSRLSDFIAPERWGDAVDFLADRMGVAKPETSGERIYSRAVESAPSAVLAPEAPVASTLSSMAGGAGSQLAAEHGAGPLGQTLAGLAAGSLPVAGAAGASALRGLVRGGEQGRQAMLSNISDANETGTPLTLGQASGNTALQYTEGALRKLPGSGPLKELPSEQGAALGSRVQSIVDSLSGGQTVSPTVAGTAINKGAEGAMANMRAAETAAYNKVHALVPPETPVDVSKTLSLLDELTKPAEGAEATTGALVPPKIKELRTNLTADMAANAAKNEPPPYVNIAQAPQPDAQAAAIAADKASGALPYGAVKQLRTSIGNSIDWGFAPADPVTNGAFKRVYGALTGDMTEGASNVSPEAASAAKAANALYALNSEKREFLNGIIDKAGGPEQVYQAATNGTKLGATKISGVMSALKPDQQNLVRATVLDRMGRATPGAQNAEGTAFSPATFLTNWSKLDPSAKDALFGASGSAGSLRSGLDSLTRTMGTIRSGTKLQNWSGTGEAVGHSAGLLAAFEGLRELAAGNPHALIGTAGAVIANNLLSRALVNPRVVNWFAQTTKAPVSALPNAVMQLSKMQDQDAQDLAAYLNQSQRPGRASGGRTGKSVDELVERLIARCQKAKRDTKKSTEPLLKAPDEAVVTALKIAQEHA